MPPHFLPNKTTLCKISSYQNVRPTFLFGGVTKTFTQVKNLFINVNNTKIKIPIQIQNRFATFGLPGRIIQCELYCTGMELPNNLAMNYYKTNTLYTSLLSKWYRTNGKINRNRCCSEGLYRPKYLCALLRVLVQKASHRNRTIKPFG